MTSLYPVAGDILGHEFMGVVEEVGPEVKGVQKGDRVVACFDIGCGQCYYCKHQLYSSCDTTNPSKEQEAMYGHRCVCVPRVLLEAVQWGVLKRLLARCNVDWLHASANLLLSSLIKLLRHI